MKRIILPIEECTNTILLTKSFKSLNYKYTKRPDKSFKDTLEEIIFNSKGETYERTY